MRQAGVSGWQKLHVSQMAPDNCSSSEEHWASCLLVLPRLEGWWWQSRRHGFEVFAYGQGGRGRAFPPQTRVQIGVAIADAFKDESWAGGV